jgi:hypothetical protein
MKKALNIIIVLTIVLMFLLNSNLLFAQEVTFTQPDANNLGLTDPGGLMGFAWGDYDDDGDLDFIICGGPMYRNDVNETGTFVQVSATVAGTDSIFYDPGGLATNSALWGDFNNDGALDLVLSTRLFLNYLADSARFSFANQFLTSAEASGAWGITAADYDQDGDLDIALAAGTVTSNYAGPIRIFQNDGTGQFTDVALDLIGFEVVMESWNPQWVDVNNDGWMDLWMPDIRTEEPSDLFINEIGAGGGLLYKAPEETGILAQSAITSQWGDYNNDGYMDLWLHPLNSDATGSPNVNNQFYMNNGDGTFTDIAPAIGFDSLVIDVGFAHRGASFGDYDNDGDQDFLIGRRSNITQDLWRNNGDGTFTYVSDLAGIDVIGGDMRSITFVDYDNDGWLDIYMMQNSTNPPYLLHNEGSNSNHWIVFKPKGTTNNTAGIGTRIEVVIGDQRQVRYVQAGASGGTNGFLWPHFGLGSATTIDRVEITWPNGVFDVLTNVAADQYLTIEEGTVGVDDLIQVPTGFALHQNYPNPFNPTTTISFNLPVRSDIRLQLVDVLGRVIKEIAAGNYEAGLHQVKLDAANLASGIYFYKLEAGNFVSTKKLVLMK